MGQLGEGARAEDGPSRLGEAGTPDPTAARSQVASGCPPHPKPWFSHLCNGPARPRALGGPAREVKGSGCREGVPPRPPSMHPCLLPSILGMHLFGCKFSLKTDTGDTVPDRKNFDSLLWAIVTVFQVSRLGGPPPGIDQSPCEHGPVGLRPER